MRFTFDQTARGAIFMGNLRFVNTLGSGVAAYPALAAAVSPAGPPGAPAAVNAVVNVCVVGAPQFVSSLPALGGDPGWTVGVFSVAKFTNRDAAPILTITDNSGNTQPQEFTTSFRSDSDTNGLVFALTDTQFAGIPRSYSVRVQYGTEASSETWNCVRFTP